MKFKQGDLVFMRRLGSNTPGEYRGKICGVSAVFPDMAFYIVEMIDKLPGYEKYDWTHVVMTDSCLELATEDEKLKFPYFM